MTVEEIKHQIKANASLHESWDHSLPFVLEFIKEEQQAYARSNQLSYEDIGRYTRFTSRLSDEIKKLVPPRSSIQQPKTPRRPALNPLPD